MIIISITRIIDDIVCGALFFFLARISEKRDHACPYRRKDPLIWKVFGYISANFAQKFSPLRGDFKQFCKNKRYLFFNTSKELCIECWNHLSRESFRSRLSWSGLNDLIITQLFVPTTVRIIIIASHVYWRPTMSPPTPTIAEDVMMLDSRCWNCLSVLANIW